MMEKTRQGCNKYIMKTTKLLITLIDAQFESERKQIKNTIIEMNHAGVSCCAEIICGYLL